MAFNLDTLVIHIIVNIIILAPVLWISGRLLVGKDKAKFTDAIWIVVVGTIVGAVFGYFFSGLIAAIIQLILWLLIVKHFFDCGWLKALAISIIAVIIFAVIVAILAVIGFALFFLI
jgi:hypothetical protein